ncbi:thioredoxin-like protein [Roridomyces roridus]|uniref:Thioredoxin-like protein n=1 Tax=Roridomyces roridus TaxID=1738132 RepID=A0AAD7C4X6_9AGAR|nr:thioredoxin-like protein [Roridomyces roridus]
MDYDNPKAASLAARIVESNRRPRHENDDELDEEALFAELEEEIENDSNGEMREYGLKVLKQQMEKLHEMRDSHHGQYSEIQDEKEVVRVSAREPRCVVHFYHSNFKRCEIMDKHLARLAPKYFNTRFFRVFVENVPWLVEKLGIKVLPCVICFVDGVSKDRLVGFEELGNSDAFDTAVLELRLANSGVIQKSTGNTLNTVYANSASSSRAMYRLKEDDEVFDLDE